MDDRSENLTLKQTEDYLAPKKELDVYERSIYYHLYRHSRLIGSDEVMVSIPKLCEELHCSKNAIKSRLKTLEDKGVIRITDTGWSGTKIHVWLPEEIEGILPSTEEIAAPDIEQIDFYSDPRYRSSIFEREEGKCFYCLRELTTENYGIDHVDPQIQNSDNTYRNVVAACHGCNSSKGGTKGQDYIRGLYRRGLLSAEELEDRLTKIELLKSGNLRPILAI